MRKSLSRLKMLRRLKKGDKVYHCVHGVKEVYITDYSDVDGFNIKVHHKWYDSAGKNLSGKQCLFNNEREFLSESKV